MLRKQKIEIVQTLHNILSAATIVIVIKHHGLTADDSTQIRNHMRKIDAQFRVIKNNLIRIAIKDTPFANLSPFFQGSTAIIVSNSVLVVAKSVVLYAKDNPKFTVVGASMGAETLLKDTDVKALTELPPLEILRAKILGILQTPATRLSSIASRPAVDLCHLVQAPSEKLVRTLVARETLK